MSSEVTIETRENITGNLLTPLSRSDKDSMMSRKHHLRVRGLLVLLLVPALFAVASPSIADDSPSTPKSQFNYPGGGPERTGFYPGVKLTIKPESIWSDSFGSSVGQPVVAGDRLILGDGINHLVAVNAKDGLQIWAITEPNSRFSWPPIVIGEVIYCSTHLGITARALADGSEIWRRDIPTGADGSTPLVIDDLVIAGGSDGFLYALDIKSGAPRWQASLIADAPPDPEGFDGNRARIEKTKARPNSASSDGKLVFITIFDQCRVAAFDLKTGEPRWSYQSKGWVGGAPTVAEGKVFFGSQDHKVYAVDALTGKLAWTFETRWRADGDLAYAEGSVYVAASDGRCYRIDAKTGAKVWEYETEVGPDKNHFFLSRAPLVDAEAVYFGSWDGHLYSLNRKDGTLRWRHKPEVNKNHVGSPITDGKRLYVPIYPTYSKDNQHDDGINGIVAIGDGGE